MAHTPPVSAWASAVTDDICQDTPLFSKRSAGFTIHGYRNGNAFWVVASFPAGGRIAFRAAFALGAEIDRASVLVNEKNRVTVEFYCRCGTCRVEWHGLGDEPVIFRTTAIFTPSQDIFVPFVPRDIVPLPNDKTGDYPAGTIHLSQTGTRTGHLYFGIGGPANGSVLYVQDLTSLSEYAELTGTSLGGSVGGKWPEMGFALPAATEKPLPAGKSVVISDALVLLTPDFIDDKDAVARKYLDLVASLYVFLSKPETTYNDWPDIAARGLAHLKDNKGCWAQAGGNAFLNAYVCDYETPPEIMVQLAVLVPLMEYADWRQENDPILATLRSGLGSFFDTRLGTMRRWLPALAANLDQSEDQKVKGVMDSWYLHHPLMNLARLAQRHDAEARKMFFDSLTYAMKVARHFKYDWPVFYNMETLEVVRAETAPGKGGEKDVPGAYAHVMLQAYDLTGDERYVKEAEKAVKKLNGLGFDIFYQANNTAFAAATLLRLYKLTGNEQHLEMSYTCLACLFRNVQLWEGRYGYGKDYSRFFGIYPLSDAPYTAPYEETEVYAALTYYLQQSLDIGLRPSVKLLLAEFIRYFVYRMPFYYPCNLPPESLSETVKTGEMDPSLLIPVEDLRDGREKSGQVGQEVYGAAGAGFGIVPRQYFRCGDSGLLLFSDYPVFRFRVTGNTATFEVGGDPGMACSIRVIGDRASHCTLHGRPSKKVADVLEHAPGWSAYKAVGGSKWKLIWQPKGNQK